MLKIVYKSTDDLIPYARNSRTHSEDQVNQIVASIKEFGFTNPILIDEKGGIIAGHGRIKAAQKIGMAEVPTIELSNLTNAQKRAYIIADNKLALNAGWDDEMLKLELLDLKDMKFDLSLVGFNGDELADLLQDDSGDFLTDDNAAPPVQDRSISKPGNIWLLGAHKIMCGDSTSRADVEKLMAGSLADCMWTDPPYNVAYEGSAGKIKNDDMSDGDFLNFLQAAFDAAFAVMKSGAAAYVAHADTEGLNFRQAFHLAGFKLSSCLIWRKNSLVLGRSDYQWQHEPILYGWKKGAAHSWYGKRNKTTIQELGDPIFQQTAPNEWTISLGEQSLVISGENLQVSRESSSVFFEEKPARNADHPTMKPVALIERMLLNSTKPGAVVLDLFGGSGSTLIAAHKLGRQARLVELDPKFADVIVRRWQDFTGSKATLDGDGRTFDVIAALSNQVQEG